MESALSKPYLKPGGFSEPVIAMKKLLTFTQSKQQASNNSSTIRSKSSLLSKQIEKCCNNFSFDYLNQNLNKVENVSKLKNKKSFTKTLVKENKEQNNDNLEDCMIYSLKPDYSKKVLVYSMKDPSDFCTERNERPRKIHGNLSVDNRHKKAQSSSKIISAAKFLEAEQIVNENNFYKENIGLRGYLFFFYFGKILWCFFFVANIKKLKKELELEKERNIANENELKTFKLNLQNERTKYQRELLKFSEKIKNFKNIQSLYVEEKQNSERIEKDLIQKESLLQEYQKKFE